MRIHHFSYFFLATLLAVQMTACGGGKTALVTPAPPAVRKQKSLTPVRRRTFSATDTDQTRRPEPQKQYPSFTSSSLRERRDVFNAAVRRFDELSFLPDPLPLSEAQQQTIASCRAEAAAITAAYLQLLTGLSAAPFTQRALAAINSRWRDTARKDALFLQGECQGFLFLTDKRHASWVALVSEPSPSTQATSTATTVFPPYAKLRLLFHQGRFQEMLVIYDTFTNKELATISRDALFLLAKAMMKTGRIQDAAGLFQVIANEGGGSLDTLSPLLTAADLFFAGGDTNQAKILYTTAAKRYHALARASFWPDAQLALFGATPPDSADMALFRQLLVDFHANDPLTARSRIMAQANALIDRFPDAAGARGARSLKDLLAARFQAWFDSRVDRAMQHVAKGEFDAADTIFESMEGADLPGELRLLLAAKKAEIARLEAGHSKALLQQEQETLNKRWLDAVAFLDANKFDEAIGAFAGLLNTAFDARAREQIKIAARKAATAKRKQAAELFIKSRKAQDPQQKADLCGASKKLLLEILARYPETEISKKVKANLAVVEECIHSNQPAPAPALPAAVP